MPIKGDISASQPEEVNEWLGGLKERYLLCRDIGHQWRPHTARYVPEDGVYERVLRCSRCRTERVQVLSRFGEILTSRYDYKDGYLAPKGVGRFDKDLRSTMRLESLTRTLTDGSQ